MSDKNRSKQKPDGASRLRKAIQKKDIAGVTALLQSGADPNVTWKNGYIDGETPLMLASDAGLTEIVDLILGARADVAMRTTSEARGAGNLSALDYALNPGKKDAGYLGVVQSLIKAGSPLDVGSNNGTTPLATASRSGWKEAVVLLLKAGSQAHRASQAPAPPLHYAVLSGKVDLVALLLENGAPVDCRNERGETALMVALANGKEEAVDLLLKRGADPQARNAKNQTTLILATLFAREAEDEDSVKSIRLVNRMIDQRVGLNEKDREGKTAFDYAKDAYDPSVVKFFKGKGAKTGRQVK